MKIHTLLLLFAATASAPLFAQSDDTSETPDTVALDEEMALPPTPQVPSSLSPVDEALLRSAFAGNLDEVKLHVSKGADVNLEGAKKRTPLLLAAYNGHKLVVEFLFSKGANVNARDSDGQTALLYASKRSFNETALFLIENGADVNAQSKKRNVSALMLAAVADNAELVQILLEHGADPSQTDIFGRSAKDLAELKGNTAMADLLAESPDQESDS